MNQRLTHRSRLETVLIDRTKPDAHEIDKGEPAKGPFGIKYPTLETGQEFVKTRLQQK